MTFEDFIEQERPWSQNLHQIEQYKLVWNAAIEAAATKIVRGTNLYNISGDHISGQVIDSITQLKSS